MQMTLKTRKLDGVVVLDLSGRLCLGEPTVLFRETMRTFMNDGNKNFLINLGNISHIDSGGLGQLVLTHGEVERTGGAAKLLNLGKSVRDLLQMTKLVTVFQAFSDEAQALKSFETSVASAGAS